MLKPLYDLPRGTKGAVHSAHLEQLSISSHERPIACVFISSHCLKDAFGIPVVLIESPHVLSFDILVEIKVQFGELDAL